MYVTKKDQVFSYQNVMNIINALSFIYVNIKDELT